VLLLLLTRSVVDIIRQIFLQIVADGSVHLAAVIGNCLLVHLLSSQSRGISRVCRLPACVSTQLSSRRITSLSYCKVIYLIMNMKGVELPPAISSAGSTDQEECRLTC